MSTIHWSVTITGEGLRGEEVGSTEEGGYQGKEEGMRGGNGSERRGEVCLGITRVRGSAEQLTSSH